MLKRLYAAMFAVAITSIVVPGASAQVTNSGTVYPSINTSTLVSILNEMGMATEVAQLEDGTVVIAAQTASGNVVLVGPDYCRAPGQDCSGMGFAAMGSPRFLPFASKAENLEVINVANIEFPIGRYLIMGDDIPTVVRAEIFPYGVSRGNLSASIELMVMSAGAFFTALVETKKAVEGLGAFVSEFPSSDRKLSSSAFRSGRDLLPDDRMGQLYASVRNRAPVMELGTNRSKHHPVISSKIFQRLIKSKGYLEDHSWTQIADQAPLQRSPSPDP